MIHADVEVSGTEKSLEPGAEDSEFLGAGGQMVRKRSLLLFQPRHVRVAEHRNAIGHECEDLLDGVLETFGGLVRQAVNQIHAEAFEAKLARCENQITRHFIGLHAMNRFLYLWLKILDAHAESIEPEAPQSFQVRAIRDARVHFNSNLGVGRKRKPLPRVTEKVFHLRGTEIRGRAAAPVELNHGPLFRDPFG